MRMNGSFHPLGLTNDLKEPFCVVPHLEIVVVSPSLQQSGYDGPLVTNLVSTKSLKVPTSSLNSSR